jgi:ABC-2 type transport system permease protein
MRQRPEDERSTLLYKEVLILEGGVQTVAAPVLSAPSSSFAHALSVTCRFFPGVARSSPPRPRDDVDAAERIREQLLLLIQSKVTGNIIFILLLPLAPVEIFLPTCSRDRARCRGRGRIHRRCVDRAVPIDPLWTLARGRGSGCWVPGIVAGIWAENDQIAAFQNFS